jgi:hypothetical protein
MFPSCCLQPECDSSQCTERFEIAYALRFSPFLLYSDINNKEKKLSYPCNIILRSRWCNSIVLNLHAPTEDKIDDIKDSFYEERENVFDKIPKYNMIILLGDFKAKVDREDIFRLTIGNDSLHEISNDNAVRVVKLATSKKLTVKSTMFPHRNIRKFAWTSPNGKTHKQIDHILIDRR